MHQSENTPPASPIGHDDAAVPWTVLDMAKAIGLLLVGLAATSGLALLVAEALVDVRAAEEGHEPVTCLLSICGTRVAVHLDLTDIPLGLTVLLGASLFVELMFLASAAHFAIRKYNGRWSSLGLRSPKRGRYALTAGLFIGALATVWVYFGVLALFGVTPDAGLPEGVFTNAGPLIVTAVLSLGFAPLIEEIFFRGFIFGGLHQRWGIIAASLSSGLLFGLAHLGNPGTFYIVPPISLVGALFAWGYAYSGSIYPSIVAHFFFNLFSLTVGLAST